MQHLRESWTTCQLFHPCHESPELRSRSQSSGAHRDRKQRIASAFQIQIRESRRSVPFAESETLPMHKNSLFPSRHRSTMSIMIYLTIRLTSFLCWVCILVQSESL